MYATAILNVNAGSVNGKDYSPTAMPWPIVYNCIDGSYHIALFTPNAVKDYNGYIDWFHFPESIV